MKKIFFYIFLIISLLTLTSCRDIERVVYAKFFGPKFSTITFDSNGGSSIIKKQRVKKGRCIKKPTDPINPGFDFEGWYFEDHLWNFKKDKPIYSLTLKTKWKFAEYTIKLDTNGGIETYEDMKVSYLSEYTLPTPSKEGYVFLGWKNENQYITSNKWIYTENKVFVAEWAKENITISFVTNDSNQNINPMYVKYAEQYLLPILNKDGYRFLGWYKDQERMDFFAPNIKEDVTLVAKWESLSENPTYDLEYKLNKDGKSYSVVGIGSMPYNDVIIPKIYKGLPVISIAARAFENCSKIKTIIIPDTVTSIGGVAFYYCTNLQYIEIPESVTYIGNYAFGYCKSLKNVILPSQMTILEEGLFSYCSNLLTVQLPKKLETIRYDAFGNCINLLTIDIPYGLTTIEYYAFRGCNSLKSVNLPKTLNSIGNNAFESCDSLESIIIPNGITTIQNYTFLGCRNLKYVNIPNTIISVGVGAFSNCVSLESITLPEGLTKIGSFAFSGCKSLTSFIIPSTVTSIEEHAFQFCSNLASIVIPKKVSKMGFEVFEQCSNLTIYCEISSPLSGWNIEWNKVYKGKYVPVVWNYKGN